MRKRLLIPIALVAVIATVFGLELYAPREPRYHGRPVRVWIREGFDGNQPNPAAAREAVLACGTNAIPYYLRLLQTKPGSGLEDRLLDFLERHHWPDFGLSRRDDAFSDRDTGAEGLGILGSEAHSAVPTLIALVRGKDEEQAILAGSVLAGNGEGVLAISGLLDDPMIARRTRAAQIAGNYAGPNGFPFAPRSTAQIENSARVLVSALISRLDDTNTQVRSLSIFALGQFARLPETVVPVLITNLQVRDNADVRFASIYALEKYGPSAKAAVPVLLTVFNEPGTTTRRAVGRALMRIDDAAAAEVVKRYAALILEAKLNSQERSGMIRDLGNYGEKAAAAAPALVELTRSRDARLRELAMVTLAEIDPQAARDLRNTTPGKATEASGR